MKYFRFLGDNLDVYGPDFDIGAIYPSDYKKKNWLKVGLLAKNNPKVWEEIKKKSLSEKIEKLKKQAESEGMKLEVVLEKVDPWEGVEFFEGTDGIIRPVNADFLEFARAYQESCESKPSTESTYVEQLKRMAFEKFGEIKEGDRFDGNTMTITGHGWGYMKEHDILYFENIYLYKQGKWAERVKERVKVTGIRSELTNGVFYEFNAIMSIPTYLDGEVGQFLASKLEEYLNR